MSKISLYKGLAKPAGPVNGGAFHAPPLTVSPVFTDGQSRRESPKMASPPIPILREKSVCFFVSVATTSGHFVHKSERRTRDGAFIYALSADEISPVFAAPRHTITALFSCRFKCACPPGWQPHFRSNADKAYNTLHFASKVVCQRDTLWKPFFVGVCSHTSSKMQNKRHRSARSRC